MPSPQDDYWPSDLGVENITTPLSLMRAQSALLGQKTNQQVIANVQAASPTSMQLNWSFQLASPSLGPYRYEIFRVSHPITLYPATIMWEGAPPKVAQNENEFKEYLKQILGSDQTKKIVQALLAQAKG